MAPKGRERILHHVFGLRRIHGDPQRHADKLGPVLLHKRRKTRRITCRRITRHGSICASCKNDPEGGAIRLLNRERILAGIHAAPRGPAPAASFLRACQGWVRFDSRPTEDHVVLHPEDLAISQASELIDSLKAETNGTGGFR